MQANREAFRGCAFACHSGARWPFFHGPSGHTPAPRSTSKTHVQANVEVLWSCAFACHDFCVGPNQHLLGAVMRCLPSLDLFAEFSVTAHYQTWCIARLSGWSCVLVMIACGKGGREELESVTEIHCHILSGGRALRVDEGDR